MSDLDQTFDSFLQDEDEVDPTVSSQSLRCGTIFLVDCTTSMISSTKGLTMAIACCQKFQQSKALDAPLDMVGLVFMRTRESSPKDLKNIFIVQNLAVADVPRIIDLEGLSKLTPPELNDRFGTIADQVNKPFQFYEALWTCQNMFTACSKTLGTRQLILITDDPDPLKGNVQAQRQAKTKMADMKQAGIQIDVIPIKRQGKQFDFTIFYHDLLSDETFDFFGTDAPSCELSAPVETVDDLLMRIQSSDLPRRRVARFRFYLGPSKDMALGVASYCLIHRTTPPAPVWLSSADNRPVTVRRHRYKKDSIDVGVDPVEDLLLPHDLVRGIKLGKRYVCFEKDELESQLCSLAPVGLFLLGFKPVDQLHRHYHLRPAQFLYPDESLVRGSRLWFSTLLQTCLDRKVFGVGLYVQRKNIPPRLVALLPQAERLRSDNVQLTPPGFHIIYLPYADDFRDLELPNHGLASEEQVEAAKALIKQLSIHFDPKNFPNPTIQRYRSILEAIALERDSAEEIVDKTIPDFKMIEERAAREIETFKRLCHLNEGKPSKSSKKSSSEKISDLDSTPSVDELRSMCAKGELSRLTAPVLLQSVKSLELTPVGRKKADLIEQLTRHLS